MTDSSNSNRKPLPTLDEVEAMVVLEFPEPNSQCAFLCAELQNTVDALDDPDLTAVQRKQLTARMAAIGARLRALRCPTCFLQ